MNYWVLLPIPVPGQFYGQRVPINLQEWISLGDMQPWVMTHHHAGLMLQRHHAEREQTKTGSKGRGDGPLLRNK